MAVEIYEPVDWKNAESIQVDSDASENMSALLEVDDWAGDHWFVRGDSSYWLRQILRKKDGRRIFRAVLLRLSKDEMDSLRAENELNADRIAAMPVTPHRVR